VGRPLPTQLPSPSRVLRVVVDLANPWKFLAMLPAPAPRSVSTFSTKGGGDGQRNGPGDAEGGDRVGLRALRPRDGQSHSRRGRRPPALCGLRAAVPPRR